MTEGDDPETSADSAISRGVDSVDLLAASLRLDISDIDSFISAVAARIETLFPTNTEIRSKRKSITKKERVVEAVTVTIGDDRFSLERAKAGAPQVAATYAKAVRGIVLKTERLDIGTWTESIAKALAAEAERTGRDREALARLLGIS